MKKILILLAAAALLAALLAGCVKPAENTDAPAVSPTSPTIESQPASGGAGISVIDEIEDPKYSEKLMTIGSYDVTLGLYRYYYFALKNQMLSNDPGAFEGEKAAKSYEELREEILDYVKSIAAFYSIGKELNIEAPEGFDKDYEEYIREVEPSLGIAEDHKPGHLTDFLPVSVYRQFYALESYLQDAVVDALYSKESGYADYSAEAVAAAAEDYRSVKHILVGYNDGLTEEEALALANQLIERIRNGEDIDVLMKEYSNDYHEGSDNVYTFSYGDMVEEFEETSFALEVGELSDPVKTTFGYHIILRLPLDGGFEEEEYPDLAARKALNDYIDGMEIHPTESFASLTEEDLA